MKCFVILFLSASVSFGTMALATMPPFTVEVVTEPAPQPTLFPSYYSDATIRSYDNTGGTYEISSHGTIYTRSAHHENFSPSESWSCCE